MSLVELRVELPAYAHSFAILVPRACTIAQVKQEIYRSCLGGPRVDGQRIIFRGRYLVDHETVDELWKSPDEPCIIHLAVHPSAWSSAPPCLPAPISTLPSLAPLPPDSAISQPTHFPPSQPINASPISPMPHPLTYILNKHQAALSALTQGTPVYPASAFSLDVLRSMAIQAVEAHGWSWPVILDEEFPLATPNGLFYDCVIIDGQQFLSLRAPGIPTALQAHALEVLTYTFTLLSIPSPNITPTPTVTSQYVPMPPNLNQLLQQLGLPEGLAARNVIQNPPPNQFMPGLREIPLRPLFAPLMLLLFRTLLLLYFVAPARKPIFGILIVAWMMYEIWRPIRNALIRNLQPVAADNQERQNAPVPQPVPNPPADVPRPPQNGAVGGVAQNELDRQARAILDVVANQNISAEEEILSDNRGINPPMPSTRHKLATFFNLLITTMHPAVWNRRRAALGRREGRIRTEANMRDAVTENEDANRAQIRAELGRQYSRRPLWVREYIDRVVVGDWVDDSD